MNDPYMTDIYTAMFILFCVIVGAIWVFTRDYGGKK